MSETALVMEGDGDGIPSDAQQPAQPSAENGRAVSRGKRQGRLSVKPNCSPEKVADLIILILLS